MIPPTPQPLPAVTNGGRGHYYFLKEAEFNDVLRALEEAKEIGGLDSEGKRVLERWRILAAERE